MNRGKLSQMQFKRVRVRPIACLIDKFGVELERVDDIWRVIASSRDSITLQNPRSRQYVDLGADHVREYMTDPGRSDGFLILKSQILLLDPRGFRLEPLADIRYPFFTQVA
jgi:hypothetical protein